DQVTRCPTPLREGSDDGRVRRGYRRRLRLRRRPDRSAHQRLGAGTAEDAVRPHPQGDRHRL
ncbi:MAG: hypothetical protein AVDCRST_MAG72-247, partial [uncultured Nocardioidaceae bacterium]